MIIQNSSATPLASKESVVSRARAYTHPILPLLSTVCPSSSCRQRVESKLAEGKDERFHALPHYVVRRAVAVRFSRYFGTCSRVSSIETARDGEQHSAIPRQCGCGECITNINSSMYKLFSHTQSCILNLFFFLTLFQL